MDTWLQQQQGNNGFNETILIVDFSLFEVEFDIKNPQLIYFKLFLLVFVQIPKTN